MRAVEAPHVTLEPQTAAHADEMFVVLSDPALYEYENEPPRSLEWLRERFTKLESGRSADDVEHWLNWVIRIPSGQLIGYVQATVYPGGRAEIAYVLSSGFWGRGLAGESVAAMISELVTHYGVRSLSAVLKRENHRSFRLLARLGFTLASAESLAEHPVDPDELRMDREVVLSAPQD